MARLIVREGPSRGTAYELTEDSVTIGRDPSNSIQLPSDTVSRTHAAMEKQTDEKGGGWAIRDLNSKNGVVVNGRRVKQGALNSGDEIRLGDAQLTFVERDFDPLEAKDFSEADGSLTVRNVLRAETLPFVPDGVRPVGAKDKIHERFLALLQLGQMAGSAKSFSELFSAIAATVDSNLHPHRAVPILFDEQKGMLRPWISGRGEFDRHLSRMPISSSIVNYVRERRVAILSEAAQEDERFTGAPSITAHEITSAMCAPIQIGDRLLGAIYVDRLGAADRFTKDDLEILNAIAVQSAVAIENVRFREEIGRERYLREKEARGAYDIVGQCDAMQKVFRFIAKAAPTEASVLIEGDSGTGKELVARAIHLNSRRRHGPFEVVNCAAIAPSLVESELFGHVRGAFTGADRDRPGRFELADGGTLFLDEIGELPDSSQSKLLRAIESGELRRLGDVKDVKVDVRVVAATNKRISEETAAGRFREDLYFRLNVLRIVLPPLRDRPGDTRLLAEHFRRHFTEKCGRPTLRLDPRVLHVFETHSWPGNVRELKNAVERMVVMSEGEVMGLHLVPHEIRCPPAAGGSAEAEPAPGETAEPLSLKELEQNHVERVLRYTGGNKKEAARILGIDRSTLYAKIKTYGLENGG